ncbi:MAG: hypothetical protein AAB576_09875, partial [Elusimicrobiota bacterium]
GRTGEPELQTVGRSFNITARAVDLYWNIVSGAPADSAAITALTASSRTIPAAVPLSAGVAIFNPIYVYSTGIITATVRDQSNGAILENVSSTFPVFSLAFSSPMAVFAIPRGALIPTLGGAVFGTASDEVAVARVDVAVRENSSGLYYDWPAGTFSSAGPVLVRTNVVPTNGARVDWRYPIDDAKLTDGTSYYVLVRSSNPSSFIQTWESTFTFSPGSLSYGASDGLGSASIVPATAAACSALVSTLTFTAGAGGIGPGGGVAVRFPDGWTRPRGLSVSSDPAAGYVFVNSTSTVWTSSRAEVLFEPPAFGSATLGSGWVLLKLKDGTTAQWRAGEQATFVFNAFPPPGPGGSGAQVFDLRVQAGAAGTLASLSSALRLELVPGPPSALAFEDRRPMRLGPLQASPTMTLLVTDLCGNPVPASTAAVISLSAGSPGPEGFAADSSAQFYLSGGASTGSVGVVAGSTRSASFTYRTAASGEFQYLRASATLSGIASFAQMRVDLSTLPLAFAEVSIDTGTLVPGATSAAFSPAPGAGAVVRFRLSDPRASWEVDISTGGTGFQPALFGASGSGDPARPLQAAWNGAACGSWGCRFLPPGAYKVRLRA